MISALCLISGALIGYFAAEKNTQHDLYRSYAKGVYEGMSKSEWELRALRNRITQFEAKAQAVKVATLQEPR
jgi:hypothetical protein